MSAPTVSGPNTDRIRRVLDAPRGQRFVRPGTTSNTGLSGRSDSLNRSRNTGEPNEPTREQRLLAQMAGNPRVAYRQLHGELPTWMHVQAARLAAHGSQKPQGAQSTPVTEAPEGPRKPSPSPKRPQAPAVPLPRPATDDDPLQPRPQHPERPERPPLPRRRSQRPHSHRRPRRLRWTRTGPARLLAAYTLATSAGALAQHLATVLL